MLFVGLLAVTQSTQSTRAFTACSCMQVRASVDSHHPEDKRTKDAYAEP